MIRSFKPASSVPPPSDHISRWAGQGGSYRTVQRFFTTVLPWASVFWLFFRSHLFQKDDLYLLAGDETVVTKAGKHTYGLDRFLPACTASHCQGWHFSPCR